MVNHKVFSENALAVSLPIPLEAPVTITVFPLKESILFPENVCALKFLKVKICNWNFVEKAKEIKSDFQMSFRDDYNLSIYDFPK